jgi:hypothetical protein
METGSGAELLTGARERVGISQSELARRAGVSISVVNAYERGRRMPGVPGLQHLLTALDSCLVVEPDRAVERWQGERLKQVLDLAGHLPRRHRVELAYPRLPGT